MMLWAPTTSWLWRSPCEDYDRVCMSSYPDGKAMRLFIDWLNQHEADDLQSVYSIAFS